MRISNDFIYNIRYVREHLGDNVSFKLKQWIHCNYRIVNLHARIFSLKLFRHNNLIPPHLLNLNYNRVNCFVRHPKSVNKLERLTHKFQIKVMNIEIRDSYLSLRNFQKMSYRLSIDLSNILPTYIWNAIFKHSFMSFDNCFSRLISKSNKKFKWLRLKHLKDQFKNIKEISYSCLSGQDESTNYFFSHIPNNMDNNKIIKISVKPDMFLRKPSNPFNTVNNDWFINTTNQVVPKEVIYLLQLGDKFSLPFGGNKNKLIFEFIKDMEPLNSMYFPLLDRLKT